MRDLRSVSGQMNGLPMTITNCVMNDVAKTFHVEDKDIRGDWVPLPDTPCGREAFQFLTIPKDGQDQAFNAVHDVSDPIVWEVKELKCLKDEGAS